MITANVICRTFFIKSGNSLGTAFTIDRNGTQYLVTARHVTRGAVSRVEVFHDGQWKPLSVTTVGIGQGDVDVAVLAPKIRMSPAYALEATTDGLAYGQPVSFLGFPFGWKGGQTQLNDGYPFAFVKAGIVSAIPCVRTIWIDAHGNPGFSGGPVVFKTRPDATDLRVAGIVVKAGLDPGTRENAGFVIAESIKSATDLIDKSPMPQGAAL